MKSVKESKGVSWLLLLYSLPATQKTERVAIWRKLAKSGAVQFTTSTYLLPDRLPQSELFQWLAKEIRDYGGEATLIRAKEIEGVSSRKLIDLFNVAREREYSAIVSALRKLAAKKKSAKTDELERLQKEFRRIREIDFFDCARARDVEVLLQRMLRPTAAEKISLGKLQTRHYQNRIWVTRPRPEIDRVGSAWLIRRFIDPKAKFVFTKSVTAVRNSLAFDFPEGEFSHHADNCTFETLLERFRIGDNALRKIGEMVHDADLEDEKFQRRECIGIDRVLKGWAKQGVSDANILKQGFQNFDGLYAFLRRL